MITDVNTVSIQEDLETRNASKNLITAKKRTNIVYLGSGKFLFSYNDLEYQIDNSLGELSFGLKELEFLLNKNLIVLKDKDSITDIPEVLQTMDAEQKQECEYAKATIFVRIPFNGRFEKTGIDVVLVINKESRFIVRNPIVSAQWVYWDKNFCDAAIKQIKQYMMK